jgi:hypothetical protein
MPDSRTSSESHRAKVRRGLGLLFILALVVTLPGLAELVDRVPATAPFGTEAVVGPGPVVASDNGLFLLHGQRISPDGTNLDGAPLRTAAGFAVGWDDGWMLVNPHAKELYIRHLGATGDPELVLRIPAIGEFINAASSTSGRLAILEATWDTHPQTFWVTVTDEREVLHRTKLAQLDRARIARFGNGFLVVSYIRASYKSFTVGLWRLDGDGVPQQYRPIETSEYGFGYGALEITESGDRAILTSEANSRIISPDLSSTVPLNIGTDIARAVPLPFGDRFLVSYLRLNYPGEESRAMVIRRDGTLEGDSEADPIAFGARIGNRYLVVRPWGGTAIAEDDPRRVVAIVPMRQRAWAEWNQVDAIVSGDVTLLAMGFYSSSERFVRVDEAGVAIDPEPRPMPASVGPLKVVAIPEGFAFVWKEDRAVRFRRLTREEGWLDAEPKTLFETDWTSRVALHSNEADLLLAWSTPDEVVWSRYTYDGTPLQESPHRMPHVWPGYYRPPSEISIWGRNEERLILVQEVVHCTLSPCEVPPLRVEVIAVDANGEPRGGMKAHESYGTRGSVGLPDGTWVVSSESNVVLHLAADASMIDRREIPMLWAIHEAPQAIAPTDDGWKAIVRRPLRIVEMRGAFEPVRITGLRHVTSPRFARPGTLAYLDASPELEIVRVPWTGRLVAAEGNLSIRLTDRGQDASGKQLTVTVRNEGMRDATGVYIAASGGGVDGLVGEPLPVPTLPPGGIAKISTLMPRGISDRDVYVLSEDVIDVDPSDNSALVSEAEPESGRRRPVRK